jgi:hypothetical protein
MRIVLPAISEDARQHINRIECSPIDIIESVYE